MFRYILFFAFFFTTCSLKTQNKILSKTFKAEIVEVCEVCQNSPFNINRIQKDPFHNAHVYFSKGSLDSSFIMITKILQKSPFKNLKKQCVLYELKGRILNSKDIHPEALIYLNKTLTSSLSLKNKSVSRLYSIIGQVHIDMKNFVKGVEFLEKWKTSEKVDSQNYSINFHNLGLSYLHLKKYKKAEDNLLESLRINTQFKDTLGLARSSLDIANLYYVQYKDSLALPYFVKGLDYAKCANDLTILQNAYLNLAVVYENGKQYAKALNYRKAYEKVHDSIWNRDKIWQLAQNEKDIAVAIRDASIKSEKGKKNLYSLLAGFFLLISLGGIYITSKIVKQKKIISKQNEHLDELNTTKDKLFSILTHDLKTPIHTLKIKLYRALNEIKKIAPIQNKSLQLVTDSYQLSKQTSLMLENTLHWVLESKDQLVFQKQLLDLASVVDQVVYDYIPVLQEKEIEFTTKIDTPITVHADLNSVKVILRNLLDNAIKFSFPKGGISLEASKQEEYCILKLKDKGKGFASGKWNPEHNSLMQSTPDTEGKTGTGIGLELCNELIKKNNGSMQLFSKEGKGTSVVLNLELHEQPTL